MVENAATRKHSYNGWCKVDRKSCIFTNTQVNVLLSLRAAAAQARVGQGFSFNCFTGEWQA